MFSLRTYIENKKQRALLKYGKKMLAKKDFQKPASTSSKTVLYYSPVRKKDVWWKDYAPKNEEDWLALIVCGGIMLFFIISILASVFHHHHHYYH